MVVQRDGARSRGQIDPVWRVRPTCPLLPLRPPPFFHLPGPSDILTAAISPGQASSTGTDCLNPLLPPTTSREHPPPYRVSSSLLTPSWSCPLSPFSPSSGPLPIWYVWRPTPCPLLDHPHPKLTHFRSPCARNRLWQWYVAWRRCHSPKLPRRGREGSSAKTQRRSSRKVWKSTLALVAGSSKTTDTSRESSQISTTSLGSLVAAVPQLYATRCMNDLFCITAAVRGVKV